MVDFDPFDVLLRPENRQQVARGVERLLARIKDREEAVRLAREEEIRHAGAEKAKADLAGTRARCKTLAGFVREAWHVLEPETPLVWSWHLDAICGHLEAVTRGEINRLLITVPPGSSKSLIVSVMWPAFEWSIGRRSLRYLTTSFDEDNVKRDTRKHRDLTLSEWFQALFPEVRLVRAGETSFANSDTGTREGATFTGITGKRGDRLICDDLHSTKKAESDTERATTTRQFREGATNRLNDQRRSAIVVVMQRLHHQDVAGVILEVGMGFVHLCIPMEYEAHDERGEPKPRVTTAIGWTDPRTEDGELMDPVRFPRDVVEQLKIDMGPYAWAGQYQQRPTPREGGLFKREYFEGKIIPAAPKGTAWCRHWDLAATELKVTDTKGARTAGVLLGLAPDGRWIVGHMIAAGKEGLAVRQLIMATAQVDGYGVEISLPQDPGQSGKVQKRELIAMLSGYNAHAKPETGDKVMRATPVSVQAEAGNLWLVQGAWNSEFLDEVCLFPGGARKDIVDALSGAFGRLVHLVGQRGSTGLAGPETITDEDDDGRPMGATEDEDGAVWG